MGKPPQRSDRLSRSFLETAFPSLAPLPGVARDRRGDLQAHPLRRQEPPDPEAPAGRLALFLSGLPRRSPRLRPGPDRPRLLARVTRPRPQTPPVTSGSGGSCRQLDRLEYTTADPRSRFSGRSRRCGGSPRGRSTRLGRGSIGRARVSRGSAICPHRSGHYDPGSVYSLAPARRRADRPRRSRRRGLMDRPRRVPPWGTSVTLRPSEPAVGKGPASPGVSPAGPGPAGRRGRESRRRPSSRRGRSERGPRGRAGRRSIRG